MANVKTRRIMMRNFMYSMPTNMVFGKDTEMTVGELIKEQGAKKVLVHFGGASAEKSGLLDKVRKSLEANEIGYVELGGVVPNPRLSLIYKGVELCKAEGVDFILSVGGGSVIDSAKGIAAGVCYGGDVWDMYEGKARATMAIPMGCILTIAAAGSESSSGTVVTKDEGLIKRPMSAPCLGQKFAILNPELTYSLPTYQTFSGVVDIIMHTLERYFTLDNSMKMTDIIAEGLIRNVMDNGRILLTEPNNYEARADIMWSGTLSHSGLTELGVATDWATHELEHELSGMFDVAHGAGLSAVWGSWARYVYQDRPDRFEQFAREVFGIEGEGAATQGIEALEAFFREISMPTSIPELLGYALTEEQIELLSRKCASGGRSIGGFRLIDQPQMKDIYTMANK